MIGISLLTLVPGEVGGSETYARALTHALAEHGRLEYAAFVPPVAPDAGGGLPTTVVTEYRRAHTIGERSLAMAVAAARPGPLRRRLARARAMHFPLTIELPTVDRPRVVTVHDLQHLEHPELFSRAERLFRRFTHERSARRAQAVIVPSEFVRRSVIERLAIPAERVRAIHHGVDHELFSRADGARGEFLLYPARPWPHKNHERLFEAFRLLRRDRGDLELVLTGGGHEGRAVPAGVVVRGLVSQDELVSLYRRAACLVFPSLYEGFGAPPLEAMACGCPVAVARAASLPEVCGDAARYFDPDDAADIARAVSDVLDDPEPLRQRGLVHSRRFTWAASAAAHEEVYAAVVS